jgi:hypothetical protein
LGTIVDQKSGNDLPDLAERKDLERSLGEVASLVRRGVADCLRLVLDELGKDIAKASDRLATVREDARRPSIKRLSAEDVHDRLAGFERAYAAATGRKLSSEEFYAQFTAGEFDDRFGLRWATFYEAAQRTPRSSGQSATATS